MPAEMTFEASDEKLSDVLFAQRKFCVPRYQRPYSWDQEQVFEFWEDLLLSKEPYFIGSFIFNSEQVDTHGLTPVALKIKRQLQLPFIYLFLKLNVSFYDFFVYANGR